MFIDCVVTSVDQFESAVQKRITKTCRIRIIPISPRRLRVTIRTAPSDIENEEGFDHSQFDDPIESEMDELAEAPDRDATDESLGQSSSRQSSEPAHHESLAGKTGIPTEDDMVEAVAEEIDDEEDAIAENQRCAQHTSLQCLALIARHHGLEVSADRLIHDYSLEDETPSLRRILRIAKDTGLKAKHVRMTWKQFRKMDQAFPAIARLANGNYVILVGLRKIEDEEGNPTEQLAVFDPMADQQGFIYLKQEQFEKSWKGEVILAKRTFSMLDSNQPFSLKWFLPEIFKQRTAFTDVAIAALFINLIALVVPLFFQIVIDKVLVNSAIDTLRC